MLSYDPEIIAAHIREIGQDVIMPRWRNLRADEIQQKTGPNDLVTIADKEAEAALAPRLLAALPDSLVLGEEAFAANPSLADTLHSGQPVWIIDPIDGTRSFATGKENFGTIVALARNNELLAGWIHHPLTGDLMTVERGSGAFWNGQRLRVLPPPSEPTSMYGLIDSRAVLSDVIKQSPRAARYTQNSFMACEVYPAMLHGEAMFGREVRPQLHYRATAYHSTPWDDAAGTLAVREAGGEVINWQGEPYRPDMFGTGTISAIDHSSALMIRDWLLSARKPLS
jgi:fructose-1,6-bisphosphatase/inositol monophosphatase family enzyme